MTTDHDANATTILGQWILFEPGAQTITDTIGAALGEHADDYDVDAILADVLTALNAALPEGVSIHGSIGEVIGLWSERDQEIDYRGIWEAVDFWAIAARHERSARYEARTYLVGSEDAAPVDVETVPAADASLTPDLSASDLGCEPGTRYRIDLIAIDTDGSETLVRSTEVTAA